MKQNRFSTKAVRLLALAGIASMTMAISHQASAAGALYGPFNSRADCDSLRSKLFGSNPDPNIVGFCSRMPWRYYFTVALARRKSW